MCLRVHSHVSMRNNRKGVQYFFAQIRYPRTLMGNCALCDCKPITILPLPTSSHTLPSALRHSSCHEKVIHVNPYNESSMLFSENPDYNDEYRKLSTVNHFNRTISSEESSSSSALPHANMPTEYAAHSIKGSVMSTGHIFPTAMASAH